ncbi:putative lipid-transfer protein DIR1 [Malania oleifera]|uniref:putative lipid-transfer protein DIR1 n=1 Tax=Malania oleifera TaxID=397392 RepID=UPI0025ADA5C0|nr:putative lipid-transfer protein DIR1 [Malania oleifera]
MEAYSSRKLLIATVVVVAAAAGMVKMVHCESICGMSTEGLAACRPSVSPAGEQGRLTPPPPSAACCSALAGANMQCLCSFKKSKLLPAFGIDPDLAMQLPAKCNLLQSFHC